MTDKEIFTEMITLVHSYIVIALENSRFTNCWGNAQDVFIYKGIGFENLRKNEILGNQVASC